MNQDDLLLKMREAGVSEDQALELLSDIAEATEAGVGNSEAKVFELQNKMADEQDWQKRAALAARIISLKLDT